jgi:predicted secreted hydrolase
MTRGSFTGTLLGVLALASLAVGTFVLVRAQRVEPVRASTTVATVLGAGDTAGYARATQPQRFEFPRDHGAHPGFRNEWWYFTGNLRAADGRRFGYQLTFFRSALSSIAPARTSAWAGSQAYMAHFAVTDAARRRFHAFQRFSRGGLGLAGARAQPFEVWLDDWHAKSEDARMFPLHVEAADSDVALRLTLEQGKPITLQGDAGLSRKGPEPGNASYYYSLTRMPTRGTIRVGKDSFNVAGDTWMDREWSTSALGAGRTGWDWFALQLDDGTDLMLYQIRHSDGSVDPFSTGTHIDPFGATRRLPISAVHIHALQTWKSPLGGAVYPARWRIDIPDQALSLEVTPILADQELNLWVRYWEGAVDVRGARAGKPLVGRGYVELTGYATTGRKAQLAH